MWEVIYTTDGIEVRFDDDNDVWLKTIPYEEIEYGIAKVMKNSIYGKTKEDNSNGTH